MKTVIIFEPSRSIRSLESSWERTEIIDLVLFIRLDALVLDMAWYVGDLASGKVEEF